MPTIYIEAHISNAPTLAGLKYAIRTMRWIDLEQLAYELNLVRFERGGKRKAMSAEHFSVWANSPDKTGNPFPPPTATEKGKNQP